MEGKTIGIVIAVLIVLAAGWYILKGTTVQAPTVMEQTVPEGTAGGTATSSAPAQVMSTAVVTYTSQGFSPASITVKQGTTVSFVNQSSESVWVASGVHPAHTLYDGTDRATHCAAGYTGPTPFDECQPGQPGTTYTFTFTKAGTWKYHNHLDPSDTGSVTVTAQ